ncbi:YczE/YyaS/YitT family protein [Bacillus massilinigeriensis]|uniref:YczE/YyaS/YitT family protein n=1 Tax=Bacillus mediterraneensis TaxID=1805474 RepID=UPI0008F86E25|nr:membrane protein [Bacillus mediterraneensis]
MQLFYRTAFFVAGLALLALGISLSIISELGSGAWDALNVGLSKTVGFTTGNWVIMVGVILIAVNSFLLKRRPEVLAIITLFLIGFLIDFWMMKVLDGIDPSTFGERIGIFAVSLLIMGAGLAIYITAKFPLSPIDNLMIALKERLGVSLGVAKTIGEATAFVGALLLGGPIGLGTIIVTFGIGPLISLFIPYTERLLAALSAKQS